jgi:hypothetical protein
MTLVATSGSDYLEMGRQSAAIKEVIKKLKEEQESLPAQLKDKPSTGSKVIVWLEWLLAFIQFFDKYFLVKGRYKKPGFFKWAAIISEVLLMGLGLKKLKFKSK